MKRKLALLLVVAIVLAGQLSAADHYAYGTPLGMRILVDPAAVSYDGMYGNRRGSLASIGYDFSANYMGFFWASGTLLTLNHRYIVAESSQARFTAESPAAVLSCQGPYTLSSDGTTPDYFAIARALRDLDLFRGTGSGFGDGFDLHLAPTRAEGLVMFIRLLGEEKDALACQYAHPYTDVPAWADRYVAWAYQRGYTNGVSPTEFGPNGDITATQYMEFLLRALGYSTAGVDDYTTALPRALALGAITQGEYNMLTQDPFLRAQVAYVSYYMLDMPVSGTQQTLAQRLQAAGLISEAQLSAARGQVDSPRLWLDSSSLH